MTKACRLIHALVIAAVALAASGMAAPGASAQSPAGSDSEGALAGPLPLSAYPRPKNDNGLGIHWSTHIYGQPNETTDYFVKEIKQMGIKWVKFLNDQVDGRDYDYLVQQLVANDIMPVMRIYTQCNEPIDLGALGRMVEHYLPMGLYYYELFNEPDIPGFDGGWCEDVGQDAVYLESIWAPAAREIEARGGYPSIPSIFPIGKGVPGWQDSFFQQFLHAIKDSGDTPLLYRSWGAVHNYFINHPPGYPTDEVNRTGRPLTHEEIARFHLTQAQVDAINLARARQFEPGGYHVGDDPDQDVTGFHFFIGYHDQFEEIFGFEIPLISTEGGATVGSCEDPRYPCVDAQMQKEWTLAAYEYMLDRAPRYFFATCTWLIAQRALDYFGGTVWEGNAWYHDRKGDHLPIVEALKKHPRKGQPRWDLPGSGDASAFECTSGPSLNNLAQYPRPAGDNGRGLHYTPTLFPQQPEVVDRFVSELLAMNIKWVKLMQGDVPKIEHQYLVEQLVAHRIEPILRVYQPYNDPYQNLSGLVSAGVPLGVHYYELYNEPNIAGLPGGWKDGETISVERLLDVWIAAAEQVREAGGYPGLPSLAVGGNYDDMRFLRDFLDGLKARQRTDLLDRAWLPLHNYFLNHPLDYPSDPVNLKSVPLDQMDIQARHLTPEQVQAINQARANARQPGGYYVGDTINTDSNGFRKFEAYAQIMFERLGYYLPIIGTEGGAIAGEQQDPRYPPVTDEDVTSLTLRAYQAMTDQAPPYFFAFTPWLMSNSSGGNWDPAWEQAAWYKLDGTVLPVVTALKADGRRVMTRDLQLQAAARPCPRPKVPPMDALSVETVKANGKGTPWRVDAAEWQSAAGPYSFLYVDVLDAAGQRASTQVRVDWTGGWTLLVTEKRGAHSATMPLVVPSDSYVIGIAQGSGQAVQAHGAPGYDLHVTFLQSQP